VGCVPVPLLIPIYFPTLMLGIGFGLGTWFGLLYSLLCIFLEKRKNKFDKDPGKPSASKHTQPPRG
jgi:hypothetical protein